MKKMLMMVIVCLGVVLANVAATETIIKQKNYISAYCCVEYEIFQPYSNHPPQPIKPMPNL
ncbi:MAG: hypothetical protein FWE90_06685 [Defluviitaleaceae bacterium]|nr:hypothetical protein [Defluviitaleaceae bacterium]